MTGPQLECFIRPENPGCLPRRARAAGARIRGPAVAAQMVGDGRAHEREISSDIDRMAFAPGLADGAEGQGVAESSARVSTSGMLGSGSRPPTPPGSGELAGTVKPWPAPCAASGVDFSGRAQPMVTIDTRYGMGPGSRSGRRARRLQSRHPADGPPAPAASHICVVPPVLAHLQVFTMSR